MVDRIPGSSVDVLSKDGSNIVQIVETKYEEISTSIQMTAGTSSTAVKFYSDCGIPGGQVYATNLCSNVPIGTQVQFTAQLTRDTCMSEAVERIPVFSIGLNESLVLSVRTECECPCEARPDSGDVSPLCQDQGRLVCGQCACNPGHYGRRCQCDGESDNLVGEDLCRASPTSPVCSGRGECNCGVCTCNPSKLGKVSGRYCECDDWTCPKDRSGALCSGQGECRCGKCACHEGWTGDTCGCSLEQEACMSPYNGAVCSGNGDCKCGSCACRAVGTGSALYIGVYCENNPLERGRGCEEVRKCVECQHFPTPDNQQECNKCGFQSKLIEVSAQAVVL